jgi:SAM-dependent methyltransferase
MKSNVDCWKALQEKDYFENHRCYMGFKDIGLYDVEHIEHFVTLMPDQTAVVVGCGYGRETAHIGRRVAHVYGIDVSERILNKARQNLHDKGLTNVSFVLADEFEQAIPPGIDLVYSVACFQHLTRDLVLNYLRVLGGKLSVNGRMVVQFLESSGGEHDAKIQVYEPSVAWRPEQIREAVEAAGLRMLGLRTEPVVERVFWHWPM